MEQINGYTLKSPLQSKHAGFCRWGFCEKNGHEYFIKEFNDPPYPVHTSELSPRIIERRLAICKDFEDRKNEFYRELRLCRSGNNMIILDFFREGSRYYAVTEKVSDAKTDPAIIAALPDDKKEILIRSILYSISLIQERGIVHGDLKPNNILLKETVAGCYTAKIIDFDGGFLLSRGARTMQGDEVYLSPEVFLRSEGEDIILDEKIDSFALGLLMHQYWCGRLPEFPEPFSFVHQAVIEGVKPELDRSIPAYIRRIIEKMLSLNPADRPSAAETLELMAQKEEPLEYNKYFSIPDSF